MKKVSIGLLAGAMMLIISILIGQIFQYLLPSIKAEYENPNLFRPWADPKMLLYFFEPFVLGVILAWVWGLTKDVLKGKNTTQKALYFGLTYWATTFPGMLMSYSSFPLSAIIVVSWSIIGLFQTISAGFIFSKLLK